jgi:hypothetical protein
MNLMSDCENSGTDLRLDFSVEQGVECFGYNLNKSYLCAPCFVRQKNLGVNFYKDFVYKVPAIPGPNESEEEFIKRLSSFQSFKKKDMACLGEEEWAPVLQRLEKTFSFSPSYLIAFYSNKNLAPWEGAATWFHKLTDETLFPIIQLRKSFKKGRFLFYDRDEVLLHESLHALRSAFDEPRFEEILASALSKKKWRSFLSPLFRKPRQALIFVATLILSLIAQGVFLFFPTQFFLLSFVSLPFFNLLWRIGCLVKDQRILKKALTKISLPGVFYLTDEEIVWFSKASKEEVNAYVQTQIRSSFRWKMIGQREFWI